MVKTSKTPRLARGGFLARFKAKLRRHPEAWSTIEREAYRRAFCRPIEELYAEIRAEGKDPEQVAKDFKNLFLAAIDGMREVSTVTAPANRDGIGIHTDPNEGEGPAGCIGPFYIPHGVDIKSVFC